MEVLGILTSETLPFSLESEQLGQRNLSVSKGLIKAYDVFFKLVIFSSLETG